MGFFSKIKQNLKHGGVKIEIQTPERITSDQPTVHVQVWLTATDAPQTIKSITATLERRYISNSANDETARQNQEFGSQDYTTPFQLLPGEAKYLEIDIPLTAEGLTGQLAGALGRLSGAFDAMSQRSYNHYVVVKADVEGIAFDPSTSQRVILEGREEPRIKFGIGT